MIKFCNKSVTISLKIIFEESLKNGIFPDIWKKGDIIPAHKKEDKTLINNYRPISLLPVFGKIFEKKIIIFFSTIFEVISFSHLLNQDFFRETHYYSIIINNSWNRNYIWWKSHSWRERSFSLHFESLTWWSHL